MAHDPGSAAVAATAPAALFAALAFSLYYYARKPLEGGEGPKP